MPPVSQVSKGVFIVPADKVDVFKDTAAGGYVSAFTKARGDQWELSLKEAASKVANAEQRFKLQMDAYQERLADLEKKRAEAAIMIDKFNADALNAAKEFNSKSSTDRAEALAKLEARRSELQAKLTYVEPGGQRVSVRTTSGTATDDDTKAAEYKLTQKELDEIGASTTAGGMGEKVQRFINKVADSSTLPSASTAQTKAQRHAFVEQLINQYASDNGVTRDQAVGPVLKELDTINQGLVTDFASVDQKISEGGGGSKTVTTTTSVAGKVARPSYGPIGAPAIAEVAPVEAEMIDKEAALKAFDTTLEGLRAARPDLPETDLIYTARRLMEKNFGPTRGTPSAFDQRRVLDALLRATPAQREGLLKRFQAAQPPAPMPALMTPSVTRELASTEVSVGPANASTPTAPVTPPAATKTMAGVSPASTSGQPAAAPSTADRLAALRSLSAGTPTGLSPVEALAGFKPAAAAGDEARMRQSQRGDMAMTGESPLMVDESPSPSRTFSVAPQERVARVGGKVYTPEEIKRKIAEIDQIIGVGRSMPQGKTLAEIQSAEIPLTAIVGRDAAGNPMTQGQYLDWMNAREARQNAAAIDSSGRLLDEDELNLKLLNYYQGEPDRMSVDSIKPRELTALDRARLISAQAKLAGGPKEGAEVSFTPSAPSAAPPGPKKPADSMVMQKRDMQVSYIQKRFKDAEELSKQPEKLGRLVANGPGKDAKQLWSTSKTLKEAFDELTLTYSNDPATLDKAHTILLAIELASKKSTDIPTGE